MLKGALIFTIPFKAVVKKNNRNIGLNRRTGQRFPIKSARLKQYEQDVCALLSSKLKRLNKPLPLLIGDVRALYIFSYKHQAKADWDNLPAALQDCAQQVGVFASDHQIKSASVLVVEYAGEEKTQVFYEGVAHAEKR
jgi:Holliday junction resolvase RusA-like endonuclease